MGKLSDMFRSSKNSDADERPPPYTGPSTGNTDQKFDGKESTSQQIPVQTVPSPAPAPVTTEPDMIITIKTGPEAKEYQFSKARLCAESRTFRDYYRPNGPGPKCTVLTYHYQPRFFDVLQHWFNTGKLPEHWYEGFVETNWAAQNIAMLYRITLNLGFLSFLNDIMDATRQLYAAKGWTILPSQITTLKEIVDMEQTLLARFFLDSLVHSLMSNPKHWQVDDEQKKKELEEMWKNHELTNKVMQHAMKWQLQRWDNPARGEGCYYHDHGDGCKKWSAPAGAGAAAAANMAMNQAAANSAAAASQAQMGAQLATNNVVAAQMASSATFSSPSSFSG